MSAEALLLRGEPQARGVNRQIRMVIPHRLVEPGAVAPRDWNSEFAEIVAPLGLAGATVFSPPDAETARRKLTGKKGMFVRAKRTDIEGEHAHRLVGSSADLEAFLDEVLEADLHNQGVVLERNVVNEPLAYQVGTATSVEGGEPTTASYYGFRLAEAPGAVGRRGSDLFVVRGNLGDLLARTESSFPRRAIEVASQFETARHAHGGPSHGGHYDILAGGADAVVGVLGTGTMDGEKAAQLALAVFEDERDVNAVMVRSRRGNPPEGALEHVFPGGEGGFIQVMGTYKGK